MKYDKALRRDAKRDKARRGMQISNRSMKTVQAALAVRAQGGAK